MLVVESRFENGRSLLSTNHLIFAGTLSHLRRNCRRKLSQISTPTYCSFFRLSKHPLFFSCEPNQSNWDSNNFRCTDTDEYFMMGKYTSTREMISFIPVITPSQFPSHTFFIYLPADDISFFSLRPRGKKGTKTLWTLLFYGDIFPHSNPIQKLQEPKKNILCLENPMLRYAIVSETKMARFVWQIVLVAVQGVAGFHSFCTCSLSTPRDFPRVAAQALRALWTVRILFIISYQLLMGCFLLTLHHCPLHKWYTVLGGISNGTDLSIIFWPVSVHNS